MTDENKTVLQSDIDAVEKEIAQKEAEKEKQRQEEVKNLLLDAEKRGKEEALKEYEQKSILNNLRDENQKMKDLVKKIEDDRKRELDLIKVETEKRFKELEGRKQGLSRNDSPFNGMNNDSDKRELDDKSIREIDEASRKAVLGW